MRPSIQRTFVALAALSVAVHSEVSTTWDTSQLIGYYIIAPNSTEVLTVSSTESWYTSGTYAGPCYTSSGCSLGTTCYGNTLYHDNGRTLACPGANSCLHFTIYATSPAGLPSASNYACREGWVANTVYRELPATTTSSSPAVSSSTRESTTSTLTPTLSITSAVASPTSFPPPAPEEQSKTWIAGAVVGPVVGIALIVAAAFWWKRRAKRGRETVEANEQGHGYMQQYTPVQQHHMKHRADQPVELPSSHHQPSELPSDRL